jgi:uncharacterized membrane protein
MLDRDRARTGLGASARRLTYSLIDRARRSDALGLVISRTNVAAEGMQGTRTVLRPAYRRCAALGRRLRPLLPADPLPPLEGRAARIGQGAVALCVVGFVLFFSTYLFAAHDAYLTHAEDMGVMSQALWNTFHGAPLHQTLCDPTNQESCLGDVSRLAIHFEPIMFVLAAIYAVFPSPKTLQFVQVLVIAAGAFPTYWIAARRLRSAAAGVVFAVLFLLSPSLDSAVTFDFHAVTLAASFLMFALYFLLTRNTVGLLVASALAITTKEEVALTILMLGLYVALIQGRRHLGGGLALGALGWIAFEVAVMHAVSPIGHSPMTSRYAAFGASPPEILANVLTHPLMVAQYFRDTSRIAYLGALLGPLAFLGVASPLSLLLAGPAIALNMLSNQPDMYSGLAQYSAEIVPVVLVASIDGAGKLSALGERVLPRSLARVWAGMRAGMRDLGPHLSARPVLFGLLGGMIAGAVAGGAGALRRAGANGWVWLRARSRGVRRMWRIRSRRAWVGQAVLLALVLVAVASDLGVQQRLNFVPLGRNFTWPQSSAHARLADTLVAQIPANASVSAQTDLVPHLSNRQFVYLFPLRALAADYLFLDVTGNIFPFGDPAAYAAQVRAVLRSGMYQTVAAQDGYLLLQRAATCCDAQAGGKAPAAQVPESFYSFTQASPDAVAHPIQGIAFDAGSATIQLLGYDVSPSPTVYFNNAILTVTTYWRVTGHLSQPVAPQIEFVYPSGNTADFTSFPATEWLPVASWPEGATMVVDSGPLVLPRREVGTMQVGVRMSAMEHDGGALGDGAIRAFALGDLRVQEQPPSELHVQPPPSAHVVVGENGTLVTFARERVVP